MNILEAMASPELFSNSFDGDSWEAWRSVLSAAFAVPMDDERTALFKELAGDREPPQERVRELWAIAGRRSAKSHTAAGIAVYMATIGAEMQGLTDKLSIGERGTVALLATDRQQAKTLLHYIRGIIESSPILAGMVVKSNTESIELNNRIDITISTANFKAIRSKTCICIILDEVAFFRDQDTSEASDKEIYRAAVPALATVNGLLIGISSPYSKKGLLHDKYERHFGNNDNVLVVKGRTDQFNPLIDQQVIQDAIEYDPESAKSEWLGEFREGLASFVSRALVEDCTRQRPLIIPPETGKRYTAFADPSGGGEGARADEFTLAIGYQENGKVIACGIWGMKGAPDAIIREYATILQAYGISQVFSDRYAGKFPQIEFERNKISLKYTEKNRSQLYAELLPALNTGSVQLPNDPVLIGQLCALERKTGRLQDIIDHPPNGSDDRANALAGLVFHAGINNRRLPNIKIRFAI